MDNRNYVEDKLKKLFQIEFIDKKELTAITGLLPGGTKGDLKNKDGCLKYTRAIDTNEYFSKQDTPYIYPLLKAHKLTLDELKVIKPEEVYEKKTARLVIGMSSCQMSRVQAWLESFLTPLSKVYGNFEYTKDSTDILIDFEKANENAKNERWNFDDLLMFGIDVQALYPSIQFEYLQLALDDCFSTCTKWSESTRMLLIDLIIYTLKNQQIYWNQTYYTLNKGIPTGGKHCVPLANIFLSFIMKTLLRTNLVFRNLFNKSVKLWKRYIDDCGGIFTGIKDFDLFFKFLEDKFEEFGLNLTHEVSRHKLILLDIEIYIENDTFHTKEHRKETASNSYIKFGSAHPSHSFKGIVKSQMYRLRRLCSKDGDFISAIENLKIRCYNSGYDRDMVDGILDKAKDLQRNLIKATHPSKNSNIKTIRWVVLSGTFYEKIIQEFARNLNNLLESQNIRFELVKSTGSNLSQLLFSNREKYKKRQKCNLKKCFICSQRIRSMESKIISKLSQQKYHIDSNMNCEDRGIYRITCPCKAAYTGKTTTSFVQRFEEHFKGNSSISEHVKSCTMGNRKSDYELQFLENCLNRGKYTLSEREYLWNERLGGELNVQKILK